MKDQALRRTRWQVGRAHRSTPLANRNGRVKRRMGGVLPAEDAEGRMAGYSEDTGNRLG